MRASPALRFRSSPSSVEGEANAQDDGLFGGLRDRRHESGDRSHTEGEKTHTHPLSVVVCRPLLTLLLMSASWGGISAIPTHQSSSHCPHYLLNHPSGVPEPPPQVSWPLVYSTPPSHAPMFHPPTHARKCVHACTCGCVPLCAFLCVYVYV